MRSKYLMGSIFVIFILVNVRVFAQEQPGHMKGWEAGSPYNNHYKASELDNFRATVVEVLEVVPMKGMSPASAITIKESNDDDPIMVHICPAWFTGKDSLGLKKGDRIKIRGVWAEIEGRDVFMAAKIKKGDYFELKVRLTKDGTPFWTMTEEQLAQERSGE